MISKLNILKRRNLQTIWDTGAYLSLSLDKWDFIFDEQTTKTVTRLTSSANKFNIYSIRGLALFYWCKIVVNILFIDGSGILTPELIIKQIALCSLCAINRYTV